MTRCRMFAAALCLLALGPGCKRSQEPPESTDEALPKATAVASIEAAPQGAPVPSLVLSQAVFTTKDGKTTAGAARLSIWRNEGGNWQHYQLEDADSNVFHGSHPDRSGLLTLGGERALLRRWTRQEGRWQHETLWEGRWGGRFNRLRDLERGDVDHDGEDEFIVATHDQGVVAVIEQATAGQPARVVETEPVADTFVHEIEVADLDGDGRLEFFATASGRNQLRRSQGGSVVMYRHQDGRFQASVVERREDRHAKEILATRLSDEAGASLFSVWEAALDDSGKRISPVTIRRHRLLADGRFQHDTIAELPDRQCRFLLAADFDGDGRRELVATTMNAGLFLLDSEDGEQWQQHSFGGSSGGYEHAATVGDLDGDGRPELYVADDRERVLRRYRWNSERAMLEPEDIGPIDSEVITWHISATNL